MICYFPILIFGKLVLIYGLNYKIIDKNEFGIRVRNYSGIPDCNLCKNVAEKSTCKRIECAPNSYYLPDSEIEKLESELTPETFTINDLYVESKLLFNCQDQLKDLQIENKQLKERIKEFESTIENNVTELIHRTGDLTHDFWYFCAECLENFEMDENFNYCPNCGRKIIR